MVFQCRQGNKEGLGSVRTLFEITAKEIQDQKWIQIRDD